MKKEKIEVEFKQEGKFVFGRVIYMPEYLRGRNQITSKGNFKIFSRYSPHLMQNVQEFQNDLFLWGLNKDSDNKIFSHEYQTANKAKKAINGYKEAIKEWNEASEETTKNILTKTEKEYLQAVLKPFKKQIAFIAKTQWCDTAPYRISVIFNKEKKEEFYYEYLYFDIYAFEQNSRYKNMVLGRYYTLQELGL